MHTAKIDNTKTTAVTVQDGFDFDDLLGKDIKVKSEVSGGKGVIKLEGITGYGVSVDNISADGKIAQNAKVTLTDTNGKSLIFTVKDEQTTPGELKLGTVETTQESISGKEISLQVGANTADSQTLKVKIENVSTKSLGLNGDTITKMAKEGIKGTTAANDMIKSLDKALERVNTSRANLGAMQNRLETTASNLTTSNENLTAAESRIRDVDVAEEMMNLSKLNLINQAAQAMMSQAKSQPEGVMQLLR